MWGQRASWGSCGAVHMAEQALGVRLEVRVHGGKLARKLQSLGGWGWIWGWLLEQLASPASQT